MFRNALSANEKYSVLDCVNLWSPIQMQLSLKPTIYSDFFVPFLESTSNYKDFEIEDDRQSYFISEITDCERLG